MVPCKFGSGGWRPPDGALYRMFRRFRNSSAGTPALPRIYLDHAATTPLRPEARAAMEEGFRLWANPSSPHAEGRAARRALEDARGRVKAALDWAGEVIFTSGASEAAALALGRAKAERRIVSAVEHDAVFGAAPDAEVLPVAAGRPDFDAVAGEGAIVAVQHLNSETGTVLLDGAEQAGDGNLLLIRLFAERGQAAAARSRYADPIGAQVRRAGRGRRAAPAGLRHAGAVRRA